MIGVAKDLSERKAAEERLAHSNRELQDFASIASHDLQEPLRKVQVFGDRLKMKCAEQLGDEGRDYLQRMQNAVARMQSFINDLLAYSRVTTKAKPFEPVDLGKIAEEVMSDLEIRIEQTGAKVDIGPMPSLEADPLQMRQLLQNLIANALKFHRPDASPHVRVEAESVPGALDPAGRGPVCRIYVRDNGIGFEQKHADRIFKIFERLHGREEYEGTGIGLAVCRKIVDRHEGRITAEGVPNQGATFIVELPMAHQEKA
jgi:light-regulated signal transduction histidine kinase (bacteriophytochrome)